MSVLTGLQPKGVWKFFEELCGIPHGSYHEKEISDYCAAFARERGLRVYQDEAWNIVIIKKASAGYEDEEPLILQGHLDMVCEKKPDCRIDFEKDGLALKAEGDFVYAEGTTLGGDDGIAVAFALAILDDDSIPHPRLEVLFTTSEEVGMDGAKALDVSMLKGHTMLNMDSEEEGILLVSCAGGCSAALSFPLKRERRKGMRAALQVGGLQGGHSGAEIHKGRGNANVILGSLLKELKEKAPFEGILSMEGGQKDNAIPREARAELLFTREMAKKAGEVCASYEKYLKGFYGEKEPGLQVCFTELEEAEAEIFDDSAATAVPNLPNGVISMSRDIPGLVQTSLNLGVIKSTDEVLTLRYSVRSSVSTEKEGLTERLRSAALHLGGSMEVNGDYPAWEYRKDSPLRRKCVSVYEEMFGRTPKVEAIHAGLECGILSSKIPNLDCVSIGPDILDVHTTEERMSVSSVQRTYRYILEIIKRK